MTRLLPSESLAAAAQIMGSWQHIENKYGNALSYARDHQSPWACAVARLVKLTIKLINRDRMNRPNPRLKFQENHPLPFHSRPGTPFRMWCARQQLWQAKTAGRMVNLLETWHVRL